MYIAIVLVIGMGGWMAAHSEVPIVTPHSVGSFENGRVRVYELGAECFVVVTDGPSGKLLTSTACK